MVRNAAYAQTLEIEVAGNRNFKGYFRGIVKVAKRRGMSITAAGGTKMRGAACQKSLADPCAAVGYEDSRRQGGRTVGWRRVTGKGERWLGVERDGEGSS